MPMELLMTNGQHFVRTGRTASIGSSGPAYGFRRWDPFVVLCDSTAVSTDLIPVERTLGCYSDRGGLDIYRFGASRPKSVGYSGSRDWHTYGSNLAGVLGAIDLLQGRRPGIFVPGHEHSVEQMNARGSFGFRPVDDQFGYDGGFVDTVVVHGGLELPDPFVVPSWSSPNAPRGRQFGKISCQLLPDGMHFSIGEATSVNGIATPTRDIFSTIGTCEEVLFPGGWYSQVGPVITGGASVAIYIENFDVDWITTRSCDVTYQFTWDVIYLNGKYAHGKWTASHHISAFDNGIDPDFHAEADHVYSIRSSPTCSVQFHYVCTEARSNITGGLNNAGWWLGYCYQVGQQASFSASMSAAKFYSYVAFDDYTPNTRLIRRLINDKPWSRFHGAVMRSMGDIRCSAFLACSDALDSVIHAVNDNNVENLSQISGFIDILPDMREAILFVRDLSGGRFLSSVKDLLDFLTALRLKQSFDWSPNLETLRTTLPAMVKIMQELSVVRHSNVAVGRGKFEYEFPVGEFGRQYTKLTTRTKVLCSRDPQSTLARVLGVKAIALLPTPATLWDLIPFSFVVDWFADVGHRIKAVEDVLFLLQLNPICFTYSYLVTSDVTDDEMAPYGLKFRTDAGSVLPEYRVFIREVSKYPAPIRDGKYDFQLPGRPPSWMTAGSLAWQLLTG